MIVLGIDPGYDRLGLAVIEQINQKPSLLFSTCLTTDKKQPFSERLLAVGSEIEKIISNWSPDLIAVEKLFFSLNQKTAMAVAETRGVIIYLGAKNNLPIIEYTPPEIKVCVTSYGSANKKQIIEMIPRLITVNKIIKHDDEYDAIAVALTHLAHSSFSRYPH